MNRKWKIRASSIIVRIAVKGLGVTITSGMNQRCLFEFIKTLDSDKVEYIWEDSVRDFGLIKVQTVGVRYRDYSVHENSDCFTNPLRCEEYSIKYVRTSELSFLFWRFWGDWEVSIKTCNGFKSCSKIDNSVFNEIKEKYKEVRV